MGCGVHSSVCCIGLVALGICSTHHSTRVGVGRMCPNCFTIHPSVGFFEEKQNQ